MFTHMFLRAGIAGAVWDDEGPLNYTSTLLHLLHFLQLVPALTVCPKERINRLKSPTQTDGEMHNLESILAASKASYRNMCALADLQI